MEPSSPVSLQASDLRRAHTLGPQTLEVLTGVSLSLAPGDSLAVTGPSGSGKSTLLHLLGTLDRPTSGTLRIGGVDPFSLPEPELAAFRGRTIGFVFQDHYLLPQYSVLENVLIPAVARPETRRGAEARARDLLARVGLAHRLGHRPSEISGGERQRAAVARALVNRPAIVLGDEPTGNLDRSTATSVADLLLELHRQERTILVVVTHSPEIAARLARRVILSEGRCAEA